MGQTRTPLHQRVEKVAAQLPDENFFSITHEKKRYCPKRQTNFATEDIQQPLRQIYRFARLPFGLIVSQNVFYKELDNALEVLQGVTGIADDNFVYGSTEKENDENLPQLQERARAERQVTVKVY